MLIQCADYDVSFLSLEDEAEQLKPFSTRARYPDDYIELELDEVDFLIKSASRIVYFCINRLQI